ncbi:fibronectin type III domain-containing protein [Phycisphaerales bacterium AB-hyl4]|uniref:Fibronectin type III domain-containing protein n=1 Tax=Natronomicrosphaera hydrolytica TaxID=3242702 RepID=A0ABV4U769_9BACT
MLKRPIESTGGLARSLTLLLALVALTPAARANDPLALYLTWQQDPTTTMTVQWHTLMDVSATSLMYRPLGETTWQTQSGAYTPFPDTPRHIHAVEITGLDPNRDYEFRLPGYSDTYKFRTMPADSSQPINFVVGGDIRQSQSRYRDMHDQVAKLDPMFAVIGGDLAYDDGRADRVNNWHQFFDAWRDRMVTPDGRLIPMLPVAGNHELTGGYTDSNDPNAGRTYFFDLFKFPGQPGPVAMDFGNYLSLVTLDTGHFVPVPEQNEWLDETLAERRERDVDHILPIYHIPAYPSSRDFDHRRITEVRDEWTPIFDKYDIDIAFEHHDHAYKRTPRIRAGEIDPTGVLYIGDGAWGASTRDVHDPDEAWWLDEAASVNHVIHMTILGEYRLLQVIDINGNIIDEYGFIPEPTSAALLLAGGLSLFARRRRQSA